VAKTGGRKRSFRGCTEDGDDAEAQQQTKDNPEIEATVALMKG